MNLDWLLAFLSLRIGDYRRSYRHLDAYLRSDSVEGFDGYYLGALLYLNRRAEGDTDAMAVAKLSTLIGRSLANEVASDLRDPKGAFRYLTLPVCGRCRGCPARRDCLYPDWKSLMLAMRRQFAAHPIDQRESLAPLFD